MASLYSDRSITDTNREGLLVTITTLEDIYAAAVSLNPEIYEDFDDFVYFVLELTGRIDTPGAYAESGLIRVTRTEHSYRVSLYPYAAFPLDYFDDY